MIKKFFTLFKVFSGNTDGNSVVEHALLYHILARYVRINPGAYHRHPMIRVEFKGCHINGT